MDRGDRDHSCEPLRNKRSGNGFTAAIAKLFGRESNGGKKFQPVKLKSEVADLAVLTEDQASIRLDTLPRYRRVSLLPDDSVRPRPA
jgi:hypothetical protein